MNQPERSNDKILRAAAAAAGIVALLSAGTASASLDTYDAKCRKALASSVGSLVKTTAVQIRKCHEQRLLGAIDSSAGCNDPDDELFPASSAAKITKAADKLISKAASKCAAAAAPSDLGYLACPSPCDAEVAAITGYDDVGSCLACTAREYTVAATQTVYGQYPPVQGSKTEAYDCQIKYVGKPFRKYVYKRLKEQRKCQYAEDKGSIADFDCDTGDLKGRIAALVADLSASVAGCNDAALAALDLVIEHASIDDTAFLWGLAADTDYVARAVVVIDGSTVQSADVAFSTGSLPNDTPTLTAYTHDAAAAHDGLTLFGVIAGSNLVYYGVDQSGEVVWYYDAGAATRGDGDVKVLDDGNLLLLLPSGFRVITPSGTTVSEMAVSSHHDVEPMPNGNYLVLQNRNETHDVPALGGDVELTVDGIQEMDSAGNVIREWWASDHLDTTRFPTELSLRLGVGPNAGYDWTHANAVEYVEESDIALISLRHQLWLVAIDWSTGNVLWRLGPDGDFTLDDPDDSAWFYAQHAPEVQDDGTILLFDNGNERPNGLNYSRAVVVGYDTATLTASVNWEYTITPQTTFLGDADRLPNNNVLACAGGIMGNNTARLIETSHGASPYAVWELEIEAGTTVYRATRVDGFWRRRQ